jgi:hypothetical protein
MTGAQDCHGWVVEIGSDVALQEIRRGNEKPPCPEGGCGLNRGGQSMKSLPDSETGRERGGRA